MRGWTSTSSLGVYIWRYMGISELATLRFLGLCFSFFFATLSGGAMITTMTTTTTTRHGISRSTAGPVRRFFTSFAPGFAVFFFRRYSDFHFYDDNDDAGGAQRLQCTDGPAAWSCFGTGTVI